jgi:vacuolar-type H+-ATPase subunit I/STV1
MTAATPSTPQSPAPAAAASSEKKESDQQADNTYYFNVVVFCLFLVGTGAIVGYAAFYSIFRDKCSQLLLASDDAHNASQAEWQSKYARSLADVRKCQQDSQAKGELQELQGRLAAQAKLSDKHQDLLERHERTLGRISELQSSNEDSQSQIQTLKDQVKKLEVSLQESVQQLTQTQQERNISQRNMKSQMDKVYNKLEAREAENLELREILDSCDGKIQNADGKVAEMKNLVQQQSYASIIALYVSQVATRCVIYYSVELKHIANFVKQVRRRTLHNPVQPRVSLRTSRTKLL